MSVRSAGVHRPLAWDLCVIVRLSGHPDTTGGIPSSGGQRNAISLE